MVVKVECDGCKSPYQVDERRIPPTGLKMRCPKCGKSLLVSKPGAEPAPAAAPAGGDEADLPAIAPRKGVAPRPAAAAPSAEPQRKAPPPRRGFGEIDLQVDLPSPDEPGALGEADFGEDDLPIVRGTAPRPAPATPAPRPGPPAPAQPFPRPNARTVRASPAALREDSSDMNDEHGGAPPILTGDPFSADSADLPSPQRPRPAPAGGRSRTASFGQLDAIDLPDAPKPGPASTRGRTVAFGATEEPEFEPAQRQPPSRRGRTVAFGGTDLDIETPAAMPSPAIPPRRGRTASFGRIDIADGLTAPRPVEAPAPPGRGRTMAFGELDVEHAIESPDDGGELDLPSSRHGHGTATHGFGELDLPLEQDDELALPSPAPDHGLPIVAAGLPTPAGAGLPSPASAGLPTPGRGPGLPSPGGVAGLPAASPPFGGPPPRRPLPSSPGPTSGVPSSNGGVAGAGVVVGAELFDEAPPGYDDSRVGAAFQTSGPRPLPPNAPAPPTPAQPPPSAAAPPPASPSPAVTAASPASPASPPVARSAPEVLQPRRAPTEIAPTALEQDLGEELSLEEAPPRYSNTGAAAVYDPSDRSSNFQGEMEDDGSIELGEPHPTVGDEVDLSGAGEEADLTAEAPKTERKRDASADEQTKRPKLRRYLIAVVAATAVAGGALALAPDIGPFGVNFVSDRLNASAHEATLGEQRARARAELGKDTNTAANKLLADIKVAQRSTPRHRPTAAYASYLAFARALRFGRRSIDEAYGKEMLDQARTRPGDLVTLAEAAQDALAGQLPKARLSAQALTARLPDDIDVAVLVGEIELAARDTAKAVEAWKRAVKIDESARTLYGLARAQQAAGDLPSAESSARAAFAASPAHAGSRILLASLLSSGGREQEALDLLAKVTDDPEIRGASADPELVEAYTLIGNIHLSRSRMSAAEHAFAAALKLDPQAVRALVGNGELFYRSGRYSEALARFEAATRAEGDNALAKVGAAKTWLAQERMKEAKDSLKKLREERPTDPLVNYWLGRAELALGNKKEAEQAYLDAVKIPENRPEIVDAYVALASLLSGLGRADDAASKLAEATEKFPDLPALHRAKGEVALQTGRYEEARKEFELALGKEEDLGTRFKLGVTFRRLHLFDDASKTFDQVAAADKDYPGLALERGLLFEETGQSERALEMYADALRKAPDDIDLKLRVGSAQVMAGYPDKAEPILREVLKNRPNSAEANHFLGRALLGRGQNLAEAMRFLERASEIDGNRAEYHLYVGWAANDAGQPGKAELSLRRSLELDQELADAYWQRGVLLQKQGATLDALKDLQIALEKRPSRYEAYATMALCYQDQGDWARAEESWRKAITANGKNSEWHYRLGKIYATRGNRQGAATEMDQAVTIAEQPDHGAPPWLFDAYFLLAESMRATGNKEKAIRGYQRFLELAPRENAYRTDAQQALQSLGATAPR
ncbi:tetratricopeptide repeat protein [Chondromyces apiculatus]|uniref:TPR domain protein, putative component of TonB system n=1 Tax=Chondromyces apiculatus DSM 436 TaxID=1192034 RepID=A0A017T4J7_9BACT|nr:tetratricopeptide repeat protein [Chondromyces apiculatus]EYF03927.1 TPR domain protein, putative component of TonB system [Chondromyces apiculatus DSM 436]